MAKPTIYLPSCHNKNTRGHSTIARPAAASNFSGMPRAIVTLLLCSWAVRSHIQLPATAWIHSPVATLQTSRGHSETAECTLSSYMSQRGRRNKLGQERQFPAVQEESRRRGFLLRTTVVTAASNKGQANDGDRNNSSSNKKKNGSSSAGGVLKGFGRPTMILKNSKNGNSKHNNHKLELDRGAATRSFYKYLEDGGAGPTLKKTALGFFPLSPNGDVKLRGVVALQDIAKGDDIIRIPYELALNLGMEGSDPTLPAVALLKEYCRSMKRDNDDRNGANFYSAYFQMLPPFGGPDCLTCTDFFSDDALEALQSPYIVDEVKERKRRVQQRFDQDIATDLNFPKWTDGTAVTVDHLQWAVWLVTSRVLTVQGGSDDDADGAFPRFYKLLIPYLDMCNHDRNSRHILTGRAVAGGFLQVKAGSTVTAGSPIHISYGGAVAGNDRFLQDYGFLDAINSKDSPSPEAYMIVAQQLLGKRRVLEGTTSRTGKVTPMSDRQAALTALRRTTVEHDEEMLRNDNSKGTTLSPDVRIAIEYRLGVKLALRELDPTLFPVDMDGSSNYESCQGKQQSAVHQRTT